MNTNKLVSATLEIVSRLLTLQDVSGVRADAKKILEQLERDMSVHAVEHPGAAYSGTRAWYLLDEMFRHETLLGADHAPTSSESLRTSAR